MNFADMIAHDYRDANGMAHPEIDWAGVVAHSAETMAEFVEAYISSDPDEITDAARDSYRALISEIRAQWEALEDFGFTMTVTDFDPYVTSKGAPNSLAMRRDVENNRHISVLATSVTGSHPLLTDEENDLFRAVHDVFGHAATERNFSANGEEAAYLHHRSMFSDAAIPALTTETRVQNSLNNLNGNSFIAQRATIVKGAENV